MKAAFTLAEVLITLGIIGVVAAMTMPALIQNHRRHVVETRLKNFYTTFNQAIQLSEVRNGDKKDWYLDASGVILDDDGKPIDSTSGIDNWFKTYLPDFIITKRKVLANGTVLYYLPNGSAFQFGNYNVTSLREISYYPSSNPEKCLKLQEQGKNIWGRCAFNFEYYPINNTYLGWRFLYNKGVEPCKFDWDGTLNGAKNDSLRGCYSNGVGGGVYCTALIQYNGWKIPDDYPHRF